MENITLELPSPETLNILELLIGLTLCLVASFILRHVYVSRSHSLSGKFHIGTVIPLLSVVTFLVIIVVKSSLALSLGLVGALSVIRFRTPIKEPEELVYLFLAIGLGLGYGAGQMVATSLVFIVAVAIIWLWLSRKSVGRQDEYNFLIDWSDGGVSASSLIDAVTAHAKAIDLQKYDSHEGSNSLFLKIAIDEFAALERIVSSVKEIDPRSSCSFYEGRPLQ